MELIRKRLVLEPAKNRLSEMPTGNKLQLFACVAAFASIDQCSAWRVTLSVMTLPWPTTV